LGTSWQRLDRLLARDHAAIGEKGHTVAHLHGERRPRAIVLLHGMSSSPPQFERFGHELYARGHNVLIPRLPHHGHADRLSTALARMRPNDLYAAAGDYVDVAREIGENVTIAGFSLGGLMAAWIAQHHEVDRCVAIAPFLGVALVPSAMMGVLAEVMLRMPNRFHWWDPIARETQGPEHGYPRYATHAVAHAYRMADELLREAAREAPAAKRIVLVANARESAVNNRAIRKLHARWNASGVEVEFVRIPGLPPSHDVIEPLRRRDLANRVYPALLEAIDPSTF
jgi:esterase/lipase